MMYINKTNFASNMMLNPLNKNHLEKIPTSKAHSITLNLEDGVAPNRKKEALTNIADFLSQNLKDLPFLIVRTNPLHEGGREEIEFLNSFNFDAVRVAKVETKEDIKEALGVLKDDKELHISLETKDAFSNLQELKIDERFTTANLGILDLLTSLNLPQSMLTLQNPTIEYILSKFLVDCKITGLNAVSFMFQDYRNIDTFTKWCEKEKLMGFSSKACMGPAQVEVANRVFGVSDEEILKAKEIVRLFEENSKKGVSGFMSESYGFIDEPIYRDALLVSGVDYSGKIKI